MYREIHPLATIACARKDGAVSQDESLLGLLLRAHAEASAQAHGEKYLHKNISASNCYEMAMGSIHGAIQNVFIAERYVAMSERKENP